MTHLISLECPKCGGALEAVTGSKQYVCQHCGMEQLLQPEGLDAALDPVVERLDQISRGVQINQFQETIQRLRLQSREHGKAVILSLVVLFFGAFLKNFLLFGPTSGWIRYLPDLVTWLGVLVCGYQIYALVRLGNDLRRQKTALQQLKRESQVNI